MAVAGLTNHRIRAQAFSPRPCLPDYRGACISGLLPALSRPPGQRPDWLPEAARTATQVVLLLIDGLGWRQFDTHRGLMPTLAAMDGRPITSVAPTTTAAALTSIATGAPPGEHGVVGYRIRTQMEILNVLRWTAGGTSALSRIVPEHLQPIEPFGGEPVVVVTKAEFRGSGFTRAHLRGGVWRPWHRSGEIPEVIGASLGEGHEMVYAYYDAVDRVVHEHGFDDHFEGELTAVDAMVARTVATMPAEACLLVTADHGLVEVRQPLVPIAPRALSGTVALSGEARFRWLHARRGREHEVLVAAREAHSDVAWVLTRREIIEQGWLGPTVVRDARERLGDVALVPFAPIGFDDPADKGSRSLIGRHGSMTPAEVEVPLLAARGSGSSG